MASSVRSSIDSFAMGAMGIGAEDREIIAQEEQTGARPAPLPVSPCPCRCSVPD